MKRISYYILIIVIFSASIVFYWVYDRYLKSEEPNVLSFEVKQGNLYELVKVRGEVALEKSFELGFPFAGTVSSVFVKEGQEVPGGVPLAKLETSDLEIELEKYESVFEQMEASLEKNRVVISNSYGDIVDILSGAYIKADEAVRIKTSGIFLKNQNYKLAFNSCDSQADIDAAFLRLAAEDELERWRGEIDALNSSLPPPILLQALSNGRSHLEMVKRFLDRTNDTLASCTISESSLDTYRSNVSTARTNTAISLSQINDHEQSINLQKEDSKVIETKIKETQSQIAAVKDKIRRSTLFSPAKGEVAKIYKEKDESFNLGEIAVSFFGELYKVQTDVSELEIGKIKTGDEVEILADAFPDRLFEGKVSSIEPKEVLKEGDKYYRVNIYFNGDAEGLRSGMSVDLKIKISSKENALYVPVIAVYSKDGKKLAKIKEESGPREVEVLTGISDGESVEILEGLKAGDTVFVSAD